jgi:hypothetical protein
MVVFNGLEVSEKGLFEACGQQRVAVLVVPLPARTTIWFRWSHPDGVRKFTERECAAGSLGRLRAVDLMSLAMANALRLKKFGA